jgi:hypothetical protein
VARQSSAKASTAVRIRSGPHKKSRKPSEKSEGFQFYVVFVVIKANQAQVIIMTFTISQFTKSASNQNQNILFQSPLQNVSKFPITNLFPQGFVFKNNLGLYLDLWSNF